MRILNAAATTAGTKPIADAVAVCGNNHYQGINSCRSFNAGSLLSIYGTSHQEKHGRTFGLQIDHRISR